MIKPKGSVERYTSPKPATLSFEPQFEIAAWSPDSGGKLPPEQVHFIIHWPAGLNDLPPMAIRFKGPDTLGFFIEELNRYRNLVWPGAEAVDIK
jgi:hypothetical protein